MALPKSVRALAGVTMLIFVYLVVQIFRAPGQIKGPDNDGSLDDMIRDPNLDGKTRLDIWCGLTQH